MMKTVDQETKPTADNNDESYEYVGKWDVKFGKHKGVLFSEVPDAYLRWAWENGVIKNDNINNYIADRLKL